jgi:hypothetical protein
MTTNTGRGSPSGPRKIRKTTALIDHGACGAAAVTLGTALIAGLKVTDVVHAVPPTAGMAAGLALSGAYCSVAGTVTIAVTNPTGAPVASGALVYPVVIFPYDS